MKIGVYGSSAGEALEYARQKAREVGRVIAEHGHTVVTGACLGLPQEAVLGAKEVGGKCVGYSPATNLEMHTKVGLPTEGLDEIIFVPTDYKYADMREIRTKYRNISSVAESDASIFIGGRVGTMNEFTLAFDFGKIMGVLEGTGGISDRAIKILLEDIDKESKGAIVFDSDPNKLISAMEIAAKK